MLNYVTMALSIWDVNILLAGMVFGEPESLKKRILSKALLCITEGFAHLVTVKYFINHGKK